MVRSWRFLKQENLSGRRFERVPIQVPAVMLVKGGNSESIFRGTAIDTSDHGVRVETSFTSLSTGQTVEVVFMGALKRALHCRVVWVQQMQAEHYGYLGLEFVSAAGAHS